MILSALVTFALAAPSVAADRPNVVIFLTDDQGYGDLGCFGHPRIKTPEIDKLARQGARLTNLYAGAPVCSCSRAALFSGRNPNRVGIRDWIPFESGIYLPRGTVTVAQTLKDAGYATCLSGKWHLNSKFDGHETTPGDFGFDHWFATQNNAKHQDPTNFVRDGQRVGPLKGHATTLIVDEAIDFVKKADRPFAVFVTFHAPHEQIETPPAYTEMYADVDDPTTRDYYGAISLIDHEVGRMVAFLDANGLGENTLVLFTSDNGPEGLRRYPKAIHSHGSAGPLRGGKLMMYEGGVRVPGVVRWPARIQPGGERAEPIVFYDVLPTLSALAGVPTPAGAKTDGVDVTPILTDDHPVNRPIPLHWQYDVAIDGPWRLAARRDRWKLLADADLKRFALYDVVADVAETRDLAAEHPDIVQKLRAELEPLVVPPPDAAGERPSEKD